MKPNINIPKQTAAESFIAGAPDAQPAKQVLPDENQKQISLKLPIELLAKIDAAAGERNVARASFIKMQMTRATAKDRPMTELQTIMLRRLSAEFDVDTTPATGLEGAALDAWIERAEDDLFEKLPAKD